MVRWLLKYKHVARQLIQIANSVNNLEVGRGRFEPVVMKSLSVAWGLELDDP